MLCTWQLPWLAVEQPQLALGGPFLTLILDDGSERQKTCLQRFNCTLAIFIRQYNTEQRSYLNIE